MTRRFQFSLRDLLWLVFVIAAFFAGMAVRAVRYLPSITSRATIGTGNGEEIEIERLSRRDGTEWFRAGPRGGSLEVWSGVGDEGKSEVRLKLPDGSRWKKINE